jgi:hypothetical protein
MVERRKEDTMEPSKIRRLLAATAVVSVLAILVISPANAYWLNEGGAGPAAAPVVGNPGDGGQALATGVAEPVATTSGSGSVDTWMIVGVAGGFALLLAAGGALLTVHHRRVALP